MTPVAAVSPRTLALPASRPRIERMKAPSATASLPWPKLPGMEMLVPLFTACAPYRAASAGSNHPLVLHGIMMVEAAIS